MHNKRPEKCVKRAFVFERPLVHVQRSRGGEVVPYRPPAFACIAARRDVLKGSRSLPCLPCRAAAAATLWTAMPKALKARPPRVTRLPPRVYGHGAGGCADYVRYGFGGSRRPRPTTPGWGSPPWHNAAAQGRRVAAKNIGERRQGLSRRRGLPCGAGGRGSGGVPRCRECPRRASGTVGALRRWHRVVIGGGGGRSAPPLRGCVDPTLEALP